MKYQINNMIAEAETVYRNILSENPTHPDALHLLGLIFYQRGDAEAAVPYIEKALLGKLVVRGHSLPIAASRRLLRHAATHHLSLS
jgi:tetratricopeptide (TPR) repeat protein